MYHLNVIEHFDDTFCAPHNNQSWVCVVKKNQLSEPSKKENWIYLTS